MTVPISQHQYKPFSFKDFYSLDESVNQKYLIESMDRMFELPEIQEIKKRAIKLLNLHKGDKVIEIGCGLGHDAEAFGEVVEESGKVIAIDSSLNMLNEAKKRSTHPQVNYVHGHGENIQYPNNFFSAGYADRLLVSQKNLSSVLGEIIRVVKPGGKICITDIDVGSAVMYPYVPKLTNILLSRLQEIIENPLIGRQLNGIFKKFGLTNTKVFSDAYVIKSFNLVNTMIDFPRMISDLCHLKRFSEEDARTLSNALAEAEQNNDFLYSIILFTVVGEKP
jgi:ubiquinone/menaquinone biosynthesis C-methylase UbiE